MVRSICEAILDVLAGAGTRDIFNKHVTGEHFTHPLVHAMPPVSALLSQLQKAAQILQNGSRVTMYCGVGCRGAKANVLALAEKLAAPVTHMLRVTDILPAIQQAIASDKPFIIDAIVSAGELAMPPHIGTDEFLGFGVSKLKKDILGIKGDHRVWKEWCDEFKVLFP